MGEVAGSGAWRSLNESEIGEKPASPALERGDEGMTRQSSDRTATGQIREQGVRAARGELAIGPRSSLPSSQRRLDRGGPATRRVLPGKN